MAKLVKYIVVIALLLLVGYKSVYVEKLDAHRERTTIKEFDAANYADNYFPKLSSMADSSILLPVLITALRDNPVKAFDQYAHSLGIGNIRYFLTQGNGVITAVNESNIDLQLNDSSHQHITIATEFVYGNALRDASGLVDLNSFTSMTDLNNVSAAVNKKVREQIIPPFIKAVNKGDEISFTGALELNKKFPELDQIEIIPVSLKKLN